MIRFSIGVLILSQSDWCKACSLSVGVGVWWWCLFDVFWSEHWLWFDLLFWRAKYQAVKSLLQTAQRRKASKDPPALMLKKSLLQMRRLKSTSIAGRDEDPAGPRAPEHHTTHESRSRRGSLDIPPMVSSWPVAHSCLLIPMWKRNNLTFQRHFFIYYCCKICSRTWSTFL